MKIGYIRVSTDEQNTARQEEMLHNIGAEKIYIDKLSGKNTQRPALKEMLQFMREGDTVIVESISRLARNTKDLLKLIDNFKEQGVEFISMKENIDTTTPTGKFTLVIFGAIADLERETLLQRQAEGIAIAKKRGVYKGRVRKKCDNFDVLYDQWKNKTITTKTALELSKFSVSTWYRRVKEKENSI